jgi:hypothetical protein
MAPGAEQPSEERKPRLPSPLSRRALFFKHFGRPKTEGAVTVPDVLIDTSIEIFLRMIEVGHVSA